jgi:hypothetical protein
MARPSLPLNAHRLNKTKANNDDDDDDDDNNNNNNNEVGYFISSPLLD